MILIKKCAAIQLAHLYEHLFCMAVQDFFYGEDLFPYLDYDLSGRTLHKGIVYIRLTLHTKEAREMAKRIPSLKIDLQQDTLMIAATQIVAECEKPVGIRDLEELHSALAALDKESWQDIDTLESIDTRNARRKIGAFYIAKGSPKPARKLTASVHLDSKFAASHRELLPLFFQLANLTSEGFQADLVSECGLYSTNIDTKTAAKTVRLSHVFKVAYGSKLSSEDVLDVMVGSVSGLHHHGGFKRFIDDLGKASHNKQSHPLPGVDAVFRDTGIFMGAKGWHKIATDENCALVLKNMRVEVKFGRDRRSHLVEPLVAVKPHPLTGPNAILK